MGSINFMGKLGSASGIEPQLKELLSDPVLHSVMSSDKVSMEALRHLISEAEVKLRPHTDLTTPPCGQSFGRKRP